MAKKKDWIIKTLKEYLSAMNRICPIEKGILFGSYAHGNPKKFSDIDLAIFTKKANNKNRLPLTALFLKETARLKLDIQPLIFPYQNYITGENDFVSEEIKKKGLSIFG